MFAVLFLWCFAFVVMFSCFYFSVFSIVFNRANRVLNRVFKALWFDGLGRKRFAKAGGSFFFFFKKKK